MLLILIVTSAFGVEKLRMVTCSMLVVLLLYLYGVGPFFGIPAIASTKHVIHLLDRTYSARPLADKLDTVAPPDETVAVFRVRRDIEYGLSFYRNHEVVNYEESGVPDRAASAGGARHRPPRRRPAHPGRAPGLSAGPSLRRALHLAGAGTGSLSRRQALKMG